MQPGASYYTFDTGLGWLLGRAAKEARAGRRVLLVTRRPRRWIERAHAIDGIDTVHFRIDKSQPSQDSLHPENIGRIFTAVRDYLDRNKGAVVIVDGADLLAFYNGFPMLIKLLYTINDVVWSSGGSVVFLIDPRTFRRKELHIVQKEFEELRNPDARVGIEDAEDA